MAMAVQQRPIGNRPQRQREPVLRRFTRQEFFERESLGGELACRVALDQRGNLVAEAEQATRLGFATWTR